MANVAVSLQVNLTGDRIDEFERARAILLSLGVKDSGLSNQRVLSAALQVLIGFHEIGGELTYKWIDGRAKNGRVKS